MKYSILALFSLGVLGACSSSIHSTQLNAAKSTSRQPSGLHYAAPKGLLSVELTETGDGNFFLALSEPFYEGDPNATFVIEPNASAFADQNFSVVVDPRTRLLEVVNSHTDGRLDEVIVNLAEAVGAAGGLTSEESGDVGGFGGALIYHRIIDPMMQPGCDYGKPCSMEEIERGLEGTIATVLNCNVEQEDDEARLCRPIRAGERFVSMSLTPLFDAIPDRPARKNRKLKTCSGAVCYRAPVPYELRLRVTGNTDSSQIVYLPNEAPILSMKMSSGVFAGAKTHISIVDGMPTYVRGDRESELAAASAVPLAAVNGLFRGASDLLTLRVKYNEDRVEYLNSQEDLDDRRAELSEKEQAKRDAEAAQQSSGDVGTLLGSEESGTVQGMTGMEGDPTPGDIAARRASGPLEVRPRERPSLIKIRLR